MRPCFFILKCKTKYIAFDALAWYTFIRTKSNRGKEEHYIMNERELREIKRRFNPDKSNISAIKGCLVNEKREIVTKFSQSVALSGAEETEELLSVMKKVLTGSLGANLIDIAFDTDDTVNGDEHGLLTALKTSGLCDENALDEFYHRAAEVIQSPRFRSSLTTTPFTPLRQTPSYRAPKTAFSFLPLTTGVKTSTTLSSTHATSLPTTQSS